MNVFKLLSRSSKAPQNSPAQKLPSSGAVANPQLFGHDESPQSANTSRKRKREQNEANPSEESSAALPADLDFFAGASKSNNDGDKATRKREKRQKAIEQKEAAAPEENDADGLENEPYDHEECKRILRSHKLKIAVLEDFAAPEEDSPKEKKKSKKRKKEKEETKPKKKDAKAQLYPQPLTEFAQLRTRYGISRRLAENIHEQGYKLPTEVQLGALPLLLGKPSRKAQSGTDEDVEKLSGDNYGGDIDLLTVAPTGSGKTIAFLIPIINALLAENKETLGKDGPRAIVLAPTRELASQIVNEARKLAKGTAVKATLMRKGMELVATQEEDLSATVATAANDSEASEAEDSTSDSEQEEKLAVQKTQKRRQAELVKAAILVATPLSLLNALKRPDGTVANLPSVRHLVLDEADVLLDPLFREQTVATWMACSSPLLRVGLWSATMGSNIDDLTTSTLTTRWGNLVKKDEQRPPLIRLVVGLKDTAIPNVSHQLTYAATEQGKLLGLRQLLHPTSASSDPSKPALRPPFLVFTQTIPRAIALHSELLYDIPPEAGGSSRIAVLHADLSSSARDAVMTRFRRGEIWVLITTDLLSRGVDFRGLNGVVNYDVPTSAAGYVHRVGRTGRAGREGGVAVTFYTQEDIQYVKLIANVIRASERLKGVKEGEGEVKQWLLDALPDVGKRERKELKKRGVEGRRDIRKEGQAGMDGGKKAGVKRTLDRISTKSGFERRVENKKRGMREAAGRRRKEEEENGVSEEE
ncbi:P-loop containing nucleoside triphosphate hydrolase protein [Phaeosphaeriaceae sp. SRC1lsM3a]|nr:P-loop containing nucleoside triphosphate hydrolase protein [Stagonospora sp. SRC1lsM3a]